MTWLIWDWLPYSGSGSFSPTRMGSCRSAEIARPFMDVVTTSGIATGHEAGDAKITDFRAGLGDASLALASGITPENAARYGRDVDCFLVATGINRDGDFYNTDPARLEALLEVTRNIGAKP